MIHDLFLGLFHSNKFYDYYLREVSYIRHLSVDRLSPHTAVVSASKIHHPHTIDMFQENCSIKMYYVPAGDVYVKRLQHCLYLHINKSLYDKKQQQITTRVLIYHFCFLFWTNLCRVLETSSSIATPLARVVSQMPRTRSI